MKKLAGRYITVIVEAIFFVIFNILAWTLVDLKKADVFFYCGYGFLALAFLLTATVFCFLKIGKNVIFSVLMPSFVANGVYFFISLVMNSIFMGFASGTNVKAVVIPNVILVLLYAAALIIAHIAISRIGSHGKEIDEKVLTLKRTAIEIGQIAELAQDAEIKKSLLQLRQAVEYSDPMGVAGTASLEDDFSKKIAEIRMLIEGSFETALIASKITAANNKLRERNELLRAMK